TIPEPGVPRRPTPSSRHGGGTWRASTTPAEPPRAGVGLVPPVGSRSTSLIKEACDDRADQVRPRSRPDPRGLVQHPPRHGGGGDPAPPAAASGHRRAGGARPAGAAVPRSAHPAGGLDGAV